MAFPFCWGFIMDECNYPNRDEDGVAQVFRIDEDSAGNIRGRLKNPAGAGVGFPIPFPHPLPVSPEGGGVFSE
jgi:hypothetical protein